MYELEESPNRWPIAIWKASAVDRLAGGIVYYSVKTYVSKLKIAFITISLYTL